MPNPSSMSIPLKTAQIGKCGELLVQYRLLLLGIEAAPMSTDAGIDLVATRPISKRPLPFKSKPTSNPSLEVGAAKPVWIGGCENHLLLSSSHSLIYQARWSGYSHMPNS